MTDKNLDVYLFENKVGVLRQRESGRLAFEYNQKWLASKNPKPLSVSLPLKKRKFEDAETRPFFAGLLPDDAVRAKLAKILGVSEKNDYALLEELGRECAGAISLYPAGQLPPRTSQSSPYYLKEEKLAELISVLPNRPLLAGLSGLKLSLAGAQNKMVVRFFDNEFSLPNETLHSTHIIKPAIHGVDQSIANEFFCMQLAQMVSGLVPVPNVSAQTAAGVPYLMIERYDRTALEGKIIRIHQEDFCQALGVSPERKYQSEGGPSLAQCFDLLKSYSIQPAKDRLRMTDIVIFNYLIGNTDAHGKNFSFLHAENGLILAPFYDLLSTHIYPALSTKVAMKIGGAYLHDRIIYRDWIKMAEETGIGMPYLRTRLIKLASSLPRLSHKLIDMLTAQKLYSSVYERIHALINQNADKILRITAK